MDGKFFNLGKENEKEYCEPERSNGFSLFSVEFVLVF
jgi:hypothetical protein